MGGFKTSLKSHLDQKICIDLAGDLPIEAQMSVQMRHQESEKNWAK